MTARRRETWWDGADISDTLTTTLLQQYMPDIGHFGAVLCLDESEADGRKGEEKAEDESQA